MNEKSDKPLWRVKVACERADGSHIVSNQFVYSFSEAEAEVTAIKRVHAMGAQRIERVVEVKRGRFLSDEDQLGQARALVTYHKEAWSEGFDAACRKHDIEDNERGGDA